MLYDLQGFLEVTGYNLMTDVLQESLFLEAKGVDLAKCFRCNSLRSQVKLLLNAVSYFNVRLWVTCAKRFRYAQGQAKLLAIRLLNKV